MKYAFFWIPAIDPENAAEALNAFLSSRRIVRVEKQWAAGDNPAWAFCVEYLSEASQDSVAKKNSPRIDYRKVLDSEASKLFALLREWRKKIAEEEAVPAFAIFTNEELASIAKQYATAEAFASLESLRQIPGIGEGKQQKYGEAVIGVIEGFKRNAGGVEI